MCSRHNSAKLKGGGEGEKVRKERKEEVIQRRNYISWKSQMSTE